MSIIAIILIATSVLIIGVYLFLLLRLLKSWSGMDIPKSGFAQKLTVVVPFRNEESNLQRLVKFLDKLEYPNFEVIFVNDHSEDSSMAVLLKSLTNTFLNYRIFSLSDNEGKKAALALGIAEASAEVIVSTDADCIMAPHWLTALVAAFRSDKVTMVAGPVSYLRRGAWANFLASEFQALVAVSGATIQLKKPTMANGANLAFRKSVFKELGGYKDTLETPSGDDELLMNKFQQAYPGSIAFAKNADALVGTLAPENLKALIAQRLRWASKWKLGKRKATMQLAGLIALVQLAVMGIITCSIYERSYEVLTAVLLLKLMVEWLFVGKTAKDIGASRPHIGLFILSFIIYPFYALYIALLANFGVYSWKGRRYT